MEYILNTIAFADQLLNGDSQLSIIPNVAKLGFDAVEIRNEFLGSDKSELSSIKKEADKYSLDVLYSVNDVLIKDGQLNEKFTSYVEEMSLLGSNQLKINIGSLEKVNFKELQESLKKVLDGTFELNLENNQTLSESSLEVTNSFFEFVDDSNLPGIGYCFDIANWAWLDATPEEAANSLAKRTNYLHLKNFIHDDGKLSVVSLDKGELDWKNLISKFSKVKEVGLEYSGLTDEINKDLISVRNLF